MQFVATRTAELMFESCAPRRLALNARDGTIRATRVFPSVVWYSSRVPAIALSLAGGSQRCTVTFSAHSGPRFFASGRPQGLRCQPILRTRPVTSGNLFPGPNRAGRDGDEEFCGLPDDRGSRAGTATHICHRSRFSRRRSSIETGVLREGRRFTFPG